MTGAVAWRNIWRNPVRSGVIIAAIAVGMFAGVFSTTFTKGWMNQRLEDGIETEVSHIQIHHTQFAENYDLKKFIPEGVTISEEIVKNELVGGASPRVVIQSMIASAETGTGVRINGIDPEKEKTVTNLYSKVAEGDYFETVKRNPILIGKKLAEKLKVKLHSKVVITVQDTQGHITGGAFRVCGIFDTTNGMFEEMNVFVLSDDLSRLAMLPVGASHEIAVHLKENVDLSESTELLQKQFPSLDVQNWKQLFPELGYLNEIGNLYIYIFVVIILLALGFGIVNTMLMVVLERVKEIGMLMAVGMSKIRIFTMLMLETVLLTLTGGLAGIVLGLATSFATMKNGINLSMYASGLEDFGYSAIVYPVIEPGMIVIICLLVIITGIVAAIYPARKALKYNPAEAIRTE